ncbi:uncharacterized protein LOC143910246 [Arctopsyche grandis]|uniref:uncharacterized protein LOC143910246 n=1 Tax=Arctopsyche grandis TaxID=121162 RepID=UPI00406D66EC
MEMIKWNQILSAIICLLVLPITQSYTTEDIFSSQQRLISIRNRNTGQPFSNECMSDQTNEGFEITCRDIDENADLSALLEQEVENFPGTTQIIDKLLIYGLSTDDGKLTQNWINSTKFFIKILDLYSDAMDIEKNAFDGVVFENLETLTLFGFEISTLEEDTFKGLQLLKYLEFYNCEIKIINENALKAVSLTLESLSIGELYYDPIHLKRSVQQRAKELPFDPTNLTGIVPLPKLKTVNFGFKYMNTLNAKSFSQIKACEELYIGGNKIERIGCGTFEMMKSLKTIILSANKLTTMDSCVFGDEVINNFSEDSIMVSFNSWNCNCDLNWLKQLKINKIVSDDPWCTSHSNLPFEEVDFDEEFTTEDPTTTTEGSTSTTEDSTTATEDSTTTTENSTTTTEDSTTTTEGSSSTTENSTTTTEDSTSTTEDSTTTTEDSTTSTEGSSSTTENSTTTTEDSTTTTEYSTTTTEGSTSTTEDSTTTTEDSTTTTEDSTTTTEDSTTTTEGSKSTTENSMTTTEDSTTTTDGSTTTTEGSTPTTEDSTTTTEGSTTTRADSTTTTEYPKTTTDEPEISTEETTELPPEPNSSMMIIIIVIPILICGIIAALIAYIVIRNKRANETCTTIPNDLERTNSNEITDANSKDNYVTKNIELRLIDDKGHIMKNHIVIDPS